jgi:hypothetical protein
MGVQMNMDVRTHWNTTLGQARRVAARVALGAVIGSVLCAGSADRASAQGKDLSDKSIATLMDYAWAITPAKFTLPGGKTIEVDKNNREAAMIPIEAARDVVRTGRLSANAQICGLIEEQASNYQTMMKRETSKSKWSDQQTLYISQLHLFTVMMLTGKVAVVATEGDNKDVKIEDTPKMDNKTPTCSDAEREKVKTQILAYVGTDAAPAAPAGAAAEAKKP